jgi:hypothetical protein
LQAVRRLEPFKFEICHTPIALVNISFNEATLRAVTTLTGISQLAASTKPKKSTAKALYVGAGFARPINKSNHNATREYRHTIGIGSQLRKAIIKGIHTGIAAGDEPIMPTALGVLNDIGIIKAAASDNTFKQHLKSASAWGFKPWQEFTQAEYYFREMLMRLKVQNHDTASVNRVRVLKHIITCDVDDVEESRTVDIAAIPTEVLFGKQFHATPKLHVTSFVTAEFCVPQISDVSHRGFMVRLVTIDNTLTSGVITFSAQGY